ncbi:leucine-rich repeat protein soc-2 homolog [Dreissena polymorpha]|uniref:leucine-rich repeat protein soc-2 homolog n=1 Tax=Dreissena polymorpha TaxID=45954 RepID=UPI0022642D29|nr:leucine-rich repeat protein soc-2 homolog [Dreissena polymorpha]
MGIRILVLVYLLIGVGYGFLLDDVCSTGNVCSCSQHGIYCDGKGLTEVPAFNIPGHQIDIRDILLRNNILSVLKNNAFSSLQGHVKSMLDMDISHNNISVMEDTCFKGLEDKIFMLDLESNNLHAIPMAITSLNRLSELSLSFNPIHVLDQNILSILGHTLSTFKLTLEQFQRWPNGFRYLFVLKSLFISKYNSTSIKNSDFHYMANMHLRTLAISNSPLEEFPVGICDINELTHLDISKNSFTDRTKEFFDVCHTPQRNLIFLFMQSNHFGVFPDIGKTFPAIRILDFSDNNLNYISGELTPMPALETLYLSSNNLVHFPSALSTLAPNVQSIYLHRNKIVDIGNADLMTFSHLENVFFDHNPLEYLAASSFARNTVLHQIGLSDTKLLTVPCALTSLSYNSIYVDLYNTTLECDCRMSCLSQINLSKIRFSGHSQCTQPNISVTDFITTVIQANACATK